MKRHIAIATTGGNFTVSLSPHGDGYSFELGDQVYTITPHTGSLNRKAPNYVLERGSGNGKERLSGLWAYDGGSILSGGIPMKEGQRDTNFKLKVISTPTEKRLDVTPLYLLLEQRKGGHV